MNLLSYAHLWSYAQAYLVFISKHQYPGVQNTTNERARQQWKVMICNTLQTRNEDYGIKHFPFFSVFFFCNTRYWFLVFLKQDSSTGKWYPNSHYMYLLKLLSFRLSTLLHTVIQGSFKRISTATFFFAPDFRFSWRQIFLVLICMTACVAVWGQCSYIIV